MPAVDYMTQVKLWCVLSNKCALVHNGCPDSNPMKWWRNQLRYAEIKWKSADSACKKVLPKTRSKLSRKYPAPHNYQKPLHLCRSIYGEITTKVIASPVRSTLTPLVSTQIERRTGDVSYSDHTAPAGRSLGQRAEQAVDGRRERAGLLLRSPRYGPLGFHFRGVMMPYLYGTYAQLCGSLSWFAHQ